MAINWEVEDLKRSAGAAAVQLQAVAGDVAAAAADVVAIRTWQQRHHVLIADHEDSLRSLAAQIAGVAQRVALVEARLDALEGRAHHA